MWRTFETPLVPMTASEPYNDDFMRGVGDGIQDIEALFDWHLRSMRRLAHVSEVHCIGNSMGGCAAVLFAYLLGAKTAWAVY